MSTFYSCLFRFLFLFFFSTHIPLSSFFYLFSRVFCTFYLSFIPYSYQATLVRLFFFLFFFLLLFIIAFICFSLLCACKLSFSFFSPLSYIFSPPPFSLSFFLFLLLISPVIILFSILRFVIDHQQRSCQFSI